EVVLGPDLGQCCGGRVTLAIEVLDGADLDTVRALAERERDGPFLTETPTTGATRTRRIRADAPIAVGLGAGGVLIERFGDDRRPLSLFGAGHLGRALVLALAPLPFRVDWIDGRDEAFPAAHPGNAVARRLDDPLRAVARAPAGGFMLALTHDHALDLALVDAALRRPEIAWIGCVGSKSKRARFSSKFREMGHTDAAIRRMVMPVGAGGPRSKAPAVIAAAIAVELLVADESARAGRPNVFAEVSTSEVGA
ncbi:MAG: xanthine dehydrogenase accessory protein XdhC, partial [Phyllobacteriaceae bacterium]|nr:xanthine dehydrogenase accessory protein XdhC [Phyllobacteriaceae bacterium]